MLLVFVAVVVVGAVAVVVAAVVVLVVDKYVLSAGATTALVHRPGAPGWLHPGVLSTCLNRNTHPDRVRHIYDRRTNRITYTYNINVYRPKHN